MNLFSDALQMRADLASVRPGIDIWGAVLNLPLLVGGAIFITRLEGQLILATTILSLLIAGQIHKRHPMSRLIGICHALWLPLIPFLLYQLSTADLPFWRQLWVALSTALMTASVVMDLIDLYRYARTQDKTYARHPRAG